MRGHDISVIAGTLPGSPAFERLAGVDVHRVGELGMGALRDRLQRGGFQPGDAEKKQQRSMARRAVKWAHDRVWRNVYWPDSSCLWYPHAVRAGIRLLAGREDAKLVSVSLPFIGQLVGLALHRRYPDMDWLADMGDPFAFADQAPTANPRLYARLNTTAERRVIDGADAVTVTTEALSQRFQKDYPSSVGKVFVVPPVAASLPAGGEPAFPRSSDALRLVYAGTLYSKLRSPKSMFELADALSRSLSDRRVELHILGEVRDAGDAIGAGGSGGFELKLHGPVPRRAAVATMALADALVNVGNTSAYQLPSKGVEYARIGRPVINIVNSPADPSVALFADYPGAITVPAAEAGASGTAERVLRFLGRVPAPPDEAAAAAFQRRFDPATIAAQYETILSQIT